MPANTMPITPRYAKGVAGKITTAQTDLTGATAANIVTIYTAAASGAAPADGQSALIQDATVRIPISSTAATVVLFKKVGGVRFMIKTLLVPAITVSNTVAPYDSTKIVLNEYLSPGDTLDALSNVTQETHVSVNVGEY